MYQEKMSSLKVQIISLVLLVFNSQMCVSLEENFIQRSFIGSTEKATTTSCDPDQDCKDNGQAGSLVLDPEDCHKYFVCVIINNELVASDAPITCPEGQYFNSYILACEEEVQPCSNRCGENCKFTCTIELGVIAYPGNCSSFFVCKDGYKHLEGCPPDRPYFDGQGCSIFSSLCCDFCTIDCGLIGIEIPDPCDCRRFYICTELGPPSEETHSTCPEGEIFDPIYEGCLTGNSCTPLCSSYMCNPTTAYSPDYSESSMAYSSESTIF